MFTLVKERTAWWPVNFTQTDENGDIEEASIRLKFRMVGLDETSLLGDFGRDLDAKSELRPSQRIAIVLARIVIDWEGVMHDGKALPFSEDALAMVVDCVKDFDTRIVTPAWYACMRGEPETRAKN